VEARDRLQNQGKEMPWFIVALPRTEGCIMSKKKNDSGVMDSAARETDGTGAIIKKRPAPKQVIDPVTHEWRDESKAEKWSRLATQRVTNALKRIKFLKALANKSQYHYEEDQAARLVQYLEDAVDEVTAAFQGRKEAAVDINL
jgi:hypothetical protein